MLTQNALTSLFRRSLILPATLIAFLAVGCSSDQPEHRPGGAAGQKPRTPPLAGKEIFFNGRVTAELTVGRGAGFDRNPDQEGGTSEPEHKRHGGGGSFRMGGGGGGSHGGGGHHGENGGASGGMEDQVERQQVSAMRHAANQNPPVMIHLRFTNNGTTKADLLIADFLSPLGNFVVEPEKLSLEPGQTVEVEPMTSRLAGEISGATVTLALRLDGRGEKKNVVLTIVPSAGPEAPTQNPASPGK